MPLTAGTRLGPYEILSPLGVGGMGEVYRSRDARLGRDVALKVLPDSVADDLSRRARFEQEARAASGLNHPNIIAVYDVGASDSVSYIVTEVVDGEALRALIDRGPVPVRKLLDIAVQLADGLAAAHAAGIVHRDLKPENIMLTRDGRVKILDFGLAKQTGSFAAPDGRTVSLGQTHPGTILGTASYMSPEQARGAALDFHSDQFSFGLILYEAAGGKKAFHKPDSVQTLAAIISEEPPPIEVKLPGPLRWIIDRCLAKEPRERYDSTRDLSQELRSLRDHLSESFSTDSGVAAPVAKSRRHWLRGAAIGAGVVLASLFGGFVLAQLFLPPLGPDTSHYRFTPLGTGLSVSSYPAWAPDGRSIAYTGVVNGSPQVFVRSLDSPGATQLTRGTAGQVAFWSPDSSRIFYYKEDAYSLWSVAVAGGEPELLMKDQDGVMAALSPDGKALADLRRVDGSVTVWISSPPGTAPRKYSPAPFEKTRVFSVPAMSFSPDGSTILLSIWGYASGAKEASHEWWLIPYPEGSRQPHRVLQRLPSASGILPTFSWMPDSRHVIVAPGTEPDQPSHLWMADTQSNIVWPLTWGLDAMQQPAVSPDGEKLVFSDAHSSFDLEEVPLNGGVPQTLIATDRWNFGPAWSPVAQDYAYVTDSNGPQEIWLKSVREGWSRPLVTPHQFSDSTQGFWGPVYSPDGSRVAYCRLGNVAQIWISSSSGGAPARLTREPPSVIEFPPAWSPDGSWLAYLRMEGATAALVKFRLGSSEPPILLKQKAGTLNPSWSPKGDWITFASELGDWLLISPDGKRQRELGKLKADYLLWSRDGQTLYGIHPKQDGHKVLFSIDAASGREKDIADLGTDFNPGAPWNPGIQLSLAPDGKSFATSVRKYRSDLWMLEGFNSRRRLWGWLGR